MVLGIDLERFEDADLGALGHTIAPEGLPSGTDPTLGTLLVFAAKEAIFKAQYPQTGDSMEFSAFLPTPMAASVTTLWNE